MTYREARMQAAKQLAAAGVENEAAESWFLMEAVCGISRSFYLLHEQEAMDPVQEQVYFALTRQRCGRMPLQYLTGEQEFTNVSGVDSVAPYQDHMNWIDEKGMSESSGTPAVAIGRVDVATAESGIALKLQMDPLLAANQERELPIYITMDRLHHDLVNMWIPAYEKVDTNGAVVSTVFGDPMPVNENQVIQDVVLLRTSNLILTEMAVDKLSSIGWKYPPGMSVQEIVDALAQQAKDDAAAIDPYGAQVGGDGGF